MTAKVHPTAIVDAKAELGSGVEIGPGAIVGPKCVLGDGCVLAPRAVLERNVTLGREVKIGVGAVIGGDPQDLKWAGEETFVEIGDRTAVREYVTVNRGTSHSWKTVVGRECFLMAYTHLAHDCHIGDGVLISNGSQLGGHVVVEDRAIISGLCAVHQFERIGKHSFIGGCTRVTKDVPPFVKAVGNPMKLYGLNTVGLQRSGFSEDVLRDLKRAYRLCFNSDFNLTQGVERARAEIPQSAELVHFLAFVEASARGVG
ncbi:MAG TPA: acyl-ACP--UDP-N-acetylglucosamine O-acyltransferase [Gemmatimonadaceae bacterium]|nr:acyl-ACP--UDP-N-acetylglucosamine O-acyltransferase [Gemmatimonadaceae bacterium]